jgi:hypothetical protein
VLKLVTLLQFRSAHTVALYRVHEYIADSTNSLVGGDFLRLETGYRGLILPTSARNTATDMLISKQLHL